jgi:ribonuclease BN (tRNA processing enzyme)
VRLTLLGVRGSTAAPGADFVRYGGHTSCVAVSTGHSETPRLVLDAGTGIRDLTRLLGGRAFEGSILLSHLHWDHVHGLPFFTAGDRDDARGDMYVPAQNGATALELLGRAMSPPSFPIRPDELCGTWGFHTIEPGTHDIEGLTVTSAEIVHKGGRTFGYRIDDGVGSVGYLPDHAPAIGLPPGVVDLVRGVDVLLHDAQFVETERRIADLYGHATIDDAIKFASEAGVGSLMLFHHSPARTDDQLDAIAESASGPVPVTVARQGETFEVRCA